MLFPLPRKPAAPRSIVITGAGIVTSLGTGYQVNAEGFRSGRIAFREVSLFDVSRQRVKIAGQVELPASLSTSHLSARQVGRMDRAGRLLLLAGMEAWQQSGWKAGDRIPMVLGTTSGGMSLGEGYYRQAITPPYSDKTQPTKVHHYQVQQQALDLACELDIEGPITIIANACASGANAIGHACDLILQGLADRVLTGGYDALCQLVFAGFDSLQALSTTCCRPFDRRRDGLALGEGAAILTLETMESAQKRGAEILGQIMGYGAANDDHHLTQPQPAGDAAVASMTAALDSARLCADQIGYINAHGTGTLLNDSAEAGAINRCTGAAVEKVQVSSTKAGVGHLLGAAGAVEAVVCLMALKGQWLPPSPTTEELDPACQFQVVKKPREARLEYALSNSFGFGGANASLIFRRWP